MADFFFFLRVFIYSCGLSDFSEYDIVLFSFQSTVSAKQGDGKLDILLK